MASENEARESEKISEWLEEGVQPEERPTGWMDDAPLGSDLGESGVGEGDGNQASESKGGLVLGSGLGVFAAMGAGIGILEGILTSRIYHEGARLVLAPQAALLVVVLTLALALAWQDFWAWFGLKRPKGEARLAYISPKGKGLKVLGEGIGAGIIACCLHILFVLEHAGSRWESAFPQATSLGGLALIGFTLGYVLVHWVTVYSLSPLADTNNIDRPIDFARASTFLGGILVGTLYYFEEMPSYGSSDEHVALSVVSGLGAFILFLVSLEVLRFCLIVIRAVLLVSALPAMVLLSMLLVNPHCLEPIGESHPEEMAYCVLYSTIEPDLDLPGRAPWWHAFSAGAQWEPPSGIRFVSLEGFDSQTREPNHPPQGIDSCMNELYEDPVKQMEAYGLRHFGFDHDLAHNVAHRMLITVCTRNSVEPIRALAPYYVTAVKNGMKKEAQRRLRQVNPLPTSHQYQGCVRLDPQFPNEEVQDALLKALDALDPEQRSVINRFLLGDTMKEIGEELNMPLKRVKALRYGAAAALREHLDGLRCHL